MEETNTSQTETMQENLPGAALVAEETPAEPGKTFEELIKGPYKEEYERRIQRILQRRLRSSRETEAKYEDLVGTLAKKYGVDAGDAEAVKSAVTAEKPALHAQATALYESWLQQAEEVKTLYPKLDLAQEAGNPEFTARLRQGLSVGDAYFLAHKDEILVSAMETAARNAEEKLSSALASGGLRPRENGAAAQGAARTRVDAAHMTKAQRQAYILRVQRGETIRL